MENILKSKFSFGNRRHKRRKGMGFGKQGTRRCSLPINRNSLANAKINTEYIIKSVETDNEEIKDFLFTLGCYKGETITIISILADQYIVVVKDARYSINRDLANCIIV